MLMLPAVTFPVGVRGLQRLGTEVTEQGKVKVNDGVITKANNKNLARITLQSAERDTIRNS